MTRERPAPLPPTISWEGSIDGTLRLLDQTRLPHERVVLTLDSRDGVIDAIVRLAVRGAPAIGVAAAYGLVLAVRERAAAAPDLSAVIAAQAEVLAKARPTAVNLRWALERCVHEARSEPSLTRLLASAQAIHAEDVEACRRMGRHGRDLVPPGSTVITHCNTGRLATAGDGTALSVLFAAWAQGTRFAVLADETRPLLQGARLTALELAAEGIPVEVICDGAAAGLIANGQVQAAFVGADRVAANGDAANKVGTYGLALACQAHDVPFYIVAPQSTFDPSLATGAAIPIEERDATEVLTIGTQRLAPTSIAARNPAFDITDHSLITALVTDRGVLRPPYADSIKTMFAAGR